MHPAPALEADTTPQDLRFPAHFKPASLEEQIRLTRKELNRFITRHKEATDLQRGHDALHQDIYNREVHKRRSVLYTLLQIQQAAQHSEQASQENTA